MGLDKLFKSISPDSEIAEQFKITRIKCSYFINFYIAPVFKTNLAKEINVSILLVFFWLEYEFCHAARPNGCSDQILEWECW